MTRSTRVRPFGAVSPRPLSLCHTQRVAGTSATHTPFSERGEHAGMAKELTMRNGEVVDAETRADEPDADDDEDGDAEDTDA